MDNFRRLFPFLYPHRRRLVISLICGLIVAVLWGANLTVAFPIVKVLFEKQSLAEYAEGEIAAATAKIEMHSRQLQVITEQDAALERQGLPPENPQRVEIRQAMVREQGRVNEFSRSHQQVLWLQCYILPYIPGDKLQTLAAILGVLLVATGVKCVFLYFQEVLVNSVAELVIIDVRKQMLDQTLKNDYESLSQEGTAGLMSRFTYDTEQLSTTITLFAGKLIREPLKCLACMVGALVINWRLTLLSLLFVPLLGLTINQFGVLLKRACRRMMESMSRIYKVLEETFDGIKVILAFNTGPRHRKMFDDQCNEYYRTSMKVVKLDALTRPALELLGLGAMFIALLPGVYLVLKERTDIWGIKLSSEVMDPAMLGMLYAFLAGMLDPCRKMSTSFSRVKRANAAIDRIFDVIDDESRIPEPAEPVPFPSDFQSISFQNITFRYNPRNGIAPRESVLDGLSLEVKANEVVAVVGTNGCGKSTLLNLLLRLYDPQAGDIRIDDTSIRDMRTADLRSRIGLVTQDTVLFDDTILENIRYGSPDATRQQIEKAAEMAHVLPIVERFPAGFDTRVGEKGKELSGGQRQRIALARAIVRNPSILILDEPTSAIDAESEALIHATLRDFVKGRTAFIVTHSMSESLLQFVTRIVVVASGQVVADGSHAQLMDSSPLYRRLFDAPSRAVPRLKGAVAAAEKPPVETERAVERTKGAAA